MSGSKDRPMEQRLTEAFGAMAQVVTERTAAPGHVPTETDAAPPSAPTVRRWTLPLLAASAVVAALIATVVAAHSLLRPEADRPGNSQSTPVAVPTGSPASTAQTPSVMPSRTPSIAPSTPSPAGAAWTAKSLIITPAYLGAVKNGMTLTQAETAAGLPFPGFGDGAYYPTFTSPDAPHLYLVPHGEAPFPACIGAQGDGKGTPTVSTAEGFRLGDTVTRLKEIYGDQLSYARAPTSGMSPKAGYVLTEPTGTLIFAVDATATKITEIAASLDPLTPSGCPG